MPVSMDHKIRMLRHLEQQEREAKRQSRFAVRSCATKKRYSLEPPLPNMSFRAYPCDICKGWHLTSKPKLEVVE